MKSNRLGETRAEHDSAMLGKAFYETPDYLTLIEPQNRSKCLIVGRRGTGKSALMLALEKHHSTSPRTYVIAIAPEDYEIIQLRLFATKLVGGSNKYNLARSGFKIFWRYALAMEVVCKLNSHWKFPAHETFGELSPRASLWTKSGRDFFSRFTALIRGSMGEVVEEAQVAHLAQKLPVRDLEKLIGTALTELKAEVAILIDKLDEGYEADSQGLAIVAGLAHAVSSLAGVLSNASFALFLRDNIFRGIARIDSDFSRNLEGQVLRLHWDKYDLLNMICARLRIAYQIDAESNQKLWDRCTAQDIRGQDGFLKCLQLTLYRPRDLLLLLNQAIHRANSRKREHIDNEDIESTAREISMNRLDDLRKEYESIVAGIHFLTGMFSGAQPNYIFSNLANVITIACDAGAPQDLMQQFKLVGAEGVVLQLYSIGFVGIEDEHSGVFVFCHDGKDPDIKIGSDRKILVHPCYWIALGISETILTKDRAEAIHDEYDVEVSSETPALRNRRIGQIINELPKIPFGAEGAHDFELWCKQVLEILFVKSLRNLELHPNRADLQRRDIVGSNLAANPVWSRIQTDYQSRQVVFEIKNVDRELEATEFRQMLGYLGGEYGNLGFFITRVKTPDLYKGPELDWIKEMALKQHKMMIKLTGPWLASLLSKIRSPQKHDAPNNQLGTLLDRYPRNYLNIRS